MTIWLAAAIAMLPPVAAMLWSACRGRTGQRFAAAQAASALGIWSMVLMSFAFGQPSEIDLPLTAVLLSLPGTLLLALFLERWV